MTATYEAIATTTLGSAAATVEFTSISGSFTDLVLIANIINTTNGTNTSIQFNSDTGTNYSTTTLYTNVATGATPESTRTTNAASILLDRQGDYTTSPGSGYAHIMNYSNSTTYKTVLNRFGQPNSSVEAKVGLWRSTSAITSIKLIKSSSTFAAGSSFTLYAIKAE